MKRHYYLAIVGILLGSSLRAQERRRDVACPSLPAAALARDSNYVLLPCQVTKQAEWLKHAIPIYPPLFAQNGLGGAVVLGFVVGSRGRIDAASVRVFKSPHDSFTVAVTAALRAWRADPAKFGTSRVSEFMTHAFVFVPDSAPGTVLRHEANSDTTWVFAVPQKQNIK